MLGKLSQLKNFISQAVTSVESQRPKLPSDPELDRKLKFLLDYILRHPEEEQFKAYHALQSPEMTLNQRLRQLYLSPSSSTEDLAAILHFFTFLLLNCNNQLVICKVVSEELVLAMSQVSLEGGLANSAADYEEVNSYKIALIKAYVGRMNPQTVKYMVMGDRMRIFQNCVSLYQQYLSVEEQQQFGVEATCISNCILLIVRFLGTHPQHSLDIANHEGRGIVHLLGTQVSHIHRLMVGILNSPREDPGQFELLKDKILFLVDIFSAIPTAQLRSKIVEQTARDLADLRVFFRQVVLQHTAALDQPLPNYLKNLELLKGILKLLPIYHPPDSLLPLFHQCTLPLMAKFIAAFKQVAREVHLQSTAIIQAQEVLTEHLNALLGTKRTGASILCCNMEILASVLACGQYLSRREEGGSEQQFKVVLTNLLVETAETLLGEEGEPLHEVLCYKSLKCLQLSLMQLTLHNPGTLHEYSQLRLHQLAISQLRRLLKRTELWDYVVLQYESLIRMVSESLLRVQETESWEYGFCQFHESSRHKEPQPLDALLNAILISEASRHFRFMTVERTQVDPRDIKLQKNYHCNFISAGWNLQPGCEIEEELPEVCRLSHLSRGLKIPISVLADEECLLLAHGRKVILNIRFKSIESFFTHDQAVHIKLKGLQEIVVEAANRTQREDLLRFKDYLGKRRDLSRQRELKFVHHYLDIYQADNAALIEQIGEADIQKDPVALCDVLPPPPPPPDSPQTAQIVDDS